MPKQLTDVRKFVEYVRRKDAKNVTIYSGPKSTKFKVRTAKYLYTLTETKKEKIDKIKQSLPPGIEKKEINA